MVKDNKREKKGIEKMNSIKQKKISKIMTVFFAGVVGLGSLTPLSALEQVNATENVSLTETEKTNEVTAEESVDVTQYSEEEAIVVEEKGEEDSRPQQAYEYLEQVPLGYPKLLEETDDYFYVELSPDNKIYVSKDEDTGGAKTSIKGAIGYAPYVKSSRAWAGHYSEQIGKVTDSNGGTFMNKLFVDSATAFCAERNKAPASSATYDNGKLARETKQSYALMIAWDNYYGTMNGTSSNVKYGVSQALVWYAEGTLSRDAELIINGEGNFSGKYREAVDKLEEVFNVTHGMSLDKYTSNAAYEASTKTLKSEPFKITDGSVDNEYNISAPSGYYVTLASNNTPITKVRKGQDMVVRTTNLHSNMEVEVKISTDIPKPTAMLYKHPSMTQYQDFLVPGAADPSETSKAIKINFKAALGDISISKTVNSSLPSKWKQSYDLTKVVVRVTGPDNYNKTFNLKANGTLLIEGVLLGNYIVKEISAPKGLNIDARDLKVTVEPAKITAAPQIINVEQTSMIQVSKTDSNGGTVPNFSFGVYKDLEKWPDGTLKVYKATGTNEEPEYNATAESKGTTANPLNGLFNKPDATTLLGKYETGANGILETDEFPFVLEKVYVSELQQPIVKYVFRDLQPKTAILKADGVTQLTFRNIIKEKSQILVTKKNEDNKFVQASFEVGQRLKGSTAAYTVLETITTNDFDGKAFSSIIPLNEMNDKRYEYALKELPNENYQVDGKWELLTDAMFDKNSQTYKFTKVNYYKRFHAEIKKTLNQNSIAATAEGAEFTWYNRFDEKIGVFVIKANGTAQLTNLRKDILNDGTKTYLIETKHPITAKVPKTPVRIEVPTIDVKTIIQGQRLDILPKEVLENDATEITFIKVNRDEPEVPLPGFVFTILDKNDKFVIRVLTEDKPSEISGLRRGETYQLCEEVSRDGYKQPTKKCTPFKVGDAEVITHTVIENDLTVARYTKVDQDGEPLAGALIKTYMERTPEQIENDLKLEEEKEEETDPVEEITKPLGEITKPIEEEKYSKIIELVNDFQSGKITAEEFNKLLQEPEFTKDSDVEFYYTNDISSKTWTNTIKSLEKDQRKVLIDEFITAGEERVYEGIPFGYEITFEEVSAPEGYILAPDDTKIIDESEDTIFQQVDVKALRSTGNQGPLLILFIISGAVAVGYFVYEHLKGKGKEEKEGK